jgi:hypothetical protein
MASGHVDRLNHAPDKAKTALLLIDDDFEFDGVSSERIQDPGGQR